MIENIRKKDFDLEYYVRESINNYTIRHEILHYMLNNPEIMVYYHCYYIIDKASKRKPYLFYKYWDAFVSLLSHKNSYHRNFGLTLLANLISIDKDNLFDTVLDKYLIHINDEKFMTAECCIKNLQKILNVRIDLIEYIINKLFDKKIFDCYIEKQRELIKYNILIIVDQVYIHYQNKEKMNFFIKKCTYSISPKTRKKAKELLNFL